jgi:general secretion pathway protein D
MMLFITIRSMLRLSFGIVFLSVLLGACAAKVQTKTTPAPTTEAVTAPPSTDTSAPGAAARQPVIVQGTGTLVGTPSAPTAQPANNTGQGYQLSFVDSDIPGIVASVLGDALGLPYLVDPQIRGNMTLQVARPLSREEVLPALEAALSMYGVAIVEADGVYHILPLKDAPRRVAGLRQPGATNVPGFGVQIVPLKYVSAAEMEKVLRPFAPESGILRVDEARNLLVLSGSSRELATMQELVATFDVDWLSGMSFALYPVEYVDPKTVVTELSAIFGDARSPIANLVRFMPLTRLNSVMVITHEPSYLSQAEAWIRRLDVGVSTPGRRIYVYEVQNGKAEDLAESLGRILSVTVEGTSRDAAESRSGGSGSLFESGTNNLLSSETDRANAGARPPTGASGSSSNSQLGGLKIVPNAENNSLLMYATPSEFTVIEGALKRLDVPPIQVLIEASLAEVSLTDDLRFGLQWSFQGGDGPVVLSEASNGNISQRFPGFSYLFTGRSDIRAVLNAIESVTDVNVISSPKLLVLNNREAELQIGDQVPITVQSAVGTTIDTPAIVNSVQLRDTGVILRITPRVNRSGMVLLDVAQEVSDVVPTTTSNIDSPTIQQRRISSTVAVRNGETIALGGMIRDSKSRSRGGVPLLTKIPLVGGLFGSTTNNSRRTELIVLITPRVIRSAQESNELLDDLAKEFKVLRELLDAKKDRAAPATPAPAPVNESRSDDKQKATPEEPKQ